MNPKGRLLLFVDAERGRAERIAQRLSGLRYRTLTASDGATALLQAHRYRPDVIVASARLPILDGFRMLEGLREDPETRDIQVILLTEEGGHEEVIRAWSAGADLCIPWSHGEADVLATLHRVLAPEPVAHHLAVCCECPA